MSKANGLVAFSVGHRPTGRDEKSFAPHPKANGLVAFSVGQRPTGRGKKQEARSKQRPTDRGERNSK